ncbi:hypothetical protein FH972_012341 [Carpinus fangiana]|uniref:Uncharacterized protein n=1 Tax=Carpinus fangiana TaxID=176857 RepID=A0A5N6R3S4_9ROSI|nr:hypothetical protein FH972_012341 [Carpinus fangiana]
MRCNIDLRYGVPRAISLIFVVLPSEDNPWINQNDNLGINPIFVAVVAIVIFLAFMGSFLAGLPPFSTFTFLAPLSHSRLLSPWDTMLLDCFHTTLQALPARIIFCVPQRGQEPADPPPSDQLEVAVIENESNNTCVVEIEVIENGGS